ncbi:predicted protein [Postia placenta Mad-698-R]|uniref:Uncharacterized protein n=1 Tax=Postia placenta MAD-698-R-SB12 TaxID=670580 RepID=A0A1X6MKB0_9APHY|nr:hypothetical protein POSPLADRAFT_1158046 [Postia placenta MAD-698-R-SB12]EED84666.1 predicted protein [Postia placenta Mad-698-R]OSX56891.1 hypothetical protein POSPLADRAFT_1158046 [Postia placenta MAD-698-R-SB12]
MNQVELSHRGAYIDQMNLQSIQCSSDPAATSRDGYNKFERSLKVTLSTAEEPRASERDFSSQNQPFPVATGISNKNGLPLARRFRKENKVETLFCGVRFSSYKSFPYFESLDSSMETKQSKPRNPLASIRRISGARRVKVTVYGKIYTALVPLPIPFNERQPIPQIAYIPPLFVHNTLSIQLPFINFDWSGNPYRSGIRPIDVGHIYTEQLTECMEGGRDHVFAHVPFSNIIFLFQFEASDPNRLTRAQLLVKTRDIFLSLLNSRGTPDPVYDRGVQLLLAAKGVKYDGMIMTGISQLHGNIFRVHCDTWLESSAEPSP